MQSPLLRVRDVAGTLGVSRQRVYQLIGEGRLPATRITARSIRVPAAAFEAWLDVQTDRSVDALRGRANALDSMPTTSEAVAINDGFTTTDADGPRDDAILRS